MLSENTKQKYAAFSDSIVFATKIKLQTSAQDGYMCLVWSCYIEYDPEVSSKK